MTTDTQWRRLRRRERRKARRAAQRAEEKASGVNATTHDVSIASIIRARAFSAGVDDYIAGRPPMESWAILAKWRGDQTWEYERGRLFAAWLRCYRMPMLKDGNKATIDAVVLLAEGFNCGAVI